MTRTTKKASQRTQLRVEANLPAKDLSLATFLLLGTGKHSQGGFIIFKDLREGKREFCFET
jgi:hypothetical protein